MGFFDCSEPNCLTIRFVRDDGHQVATHVHLDNSGGFLQAVNESAGAMLPGVTPPYVESLEI